MMAKNNISECADSGARGGTQLEVECLKGLKTINSLGRSTPVVDEGRRQVNEEMLSLETIETWECVCVPFRG